MSEHEPSTPRRTRAYGAMLVIGTMLMLTVPLRYLCCAIDATANTRQTVRFE